MTFVTNIYIHIFTYNTRNRSLSVQQNVPHLPVAHGGVQQLLDISESSKVFI